MKWMRVEVFIKKAAGMLYGTKQQEGAVVPVQVN